MDKAAKLAKLQNQIEANRGQLFFYKEYLQIRYDELVHLIVNTDTDSLIHKGKARMLAEQISMLS